MLKPVSEWIKHSFQTVENVSSDSLEQLLKEDRDRVVLVDVRSPGEFEVSHLQGAVRVEPDNTAMDSVIQQLDLGLAGGEELREIICYCTTGYQAAHLAQNLNTFLESECGRGLRGQLKVSNLEGGFLKWTRENRAIVDSSNQPTTSVHPYNELWVELLKAEFKAPV
uniref:Uncharacterized LOC103180580 n=1 Tax=Callorhinchus milii TaxID=7868 RepID=A0A4W3IY86_CALMI|eukprot:gi/632957852/ref/XP_007894710.1/ PREDICTED: uncharacterized protein LOC103180580 [Callorhinchus milii]